ncbi:MAG: HEAT repeat domain-containing protein [Microcoleus sp.]
MGTLIEALERIMNWLRKHQPDYAASFLPGLKSEEIQAAEAKVGFKLPPEIYELYQWRNGTEEDAKAVCFPTMQFLPLFTAVECSQGWNGYILEEKKIIEDSKWYETSPLFIFLQNNCDFCGVPIVDYQIEKSPVVVLGEGYLPYIFYTSLTDMMLTLAECYETNAYYLAKDGYIEEEECKAAVVLRKYNSELNEKALSDFQSILSQPLYFSTRDYSSSLVRPVIEATTVMGRFKDPRSVDLLLEALQVWGKVKGLSRDGVCSWVIKALGEMCDVRALQPLTNALQDDSPFVRKEAQEALLKFRYNMG